MTAARPFFLLLTALSLAFLSPACGDDGGEPRAQPAQDAPLFVSGDFGRVLIHPLAQPIGEKTNVDGVIAQSFGIRNVSRSDLFAWYADRLDGWRQEAAPAPLSGSPQASWRALWTRGDRQLVITWTPAPTVGEPASGDASADQYSLSLEPVGRPLP